MKKARKQGQAEEVLPRSAEPAELDEAILTVLCRAVETWRPVDQRSLSAAEERAIFLLTAAGMVERRVAFRLRMAGRGESVEAVITATGEQGCMQAMETVVVEAWELWSDTFKKRAADADGPPLAFECFRTRDEEMRLTECGIAAARHARSGDSREVLEFVKKTGFFGPESPMALTQPEQYVPGVGRPPVRGWGRLEEVKVDRGTPQEVKVTNMNEVAEPLKDLAEVVRRMFEQQAATFMAQMDEKLSRPTADPNDWLKDYEAHTVRSLAEVTGIDKSTLHEKWAGQEYCDRPICRKWNGRSYWLRAWIEAHRGK